MKYSGMMLLLFSTLVGAQTTYYSDSNGMPLGTAQRSGNTTYYSNANGMPVGTAQQSGNTTYYSNANGMPVGTAQAPQPIQQFPSSPKGM